MLNNRRRTSRVRTFGRLRNQEMSLLNSLSPGRIVELGIAAKTLRRPSVEEVFDAIASYDLTCTEWGWDAVPGLKSLSGRVPVETARSVARAAMRAGVRICSVSATLNLLHERVLEQLTELAGTAAEAGSELLVLRSTTPYHAHLTRQAWTAMMTALRRTNRIARRYGISIALQLENDAAHVMKAFNELGSDSEYLSLAVEANSVHPLHELEHLTLTHSIPADTLPDIEDLNALVQTPSIATAARNGQRVPLMLHGLSEGQVAASVDFLQEALETLDRSWHSKLLAEFVPAYEMSGESHLTFATLID